MINKIIIMVQQKELNKSSTVYKQKLIWQVI